MRRDRLPTPVFLGFPGDSAGKESTCNAGDLGLIPWVRMISWRREQLPTPVFWPGIFHGLYSPWDGKESDTSEQLSLSVSYTQKAEHILTIQHCVFLQTEYTHVMSTKINEMNMTKSKVFYLPIWSLLLPYTDHCADSLYHKLVLPAFLLCISRIMALTGGSVL